MGPGPGRLRHESEPFALVLALKRRKLLIAVSLGFSLLFILWIASQLSFVRGLNEVEARATATTLRYTQAEELLATIRTQRLMISIQVRDALLDPTGPDAEERRQAMARARQSIAEALTAYAPLAYSLSERADLEDLRQSLDVYWTGVMPILRSDSTTEFTEARDYLLRSGTSQREAVTRISDKIHELNRAALIRQQADAAREYRTLDNRIRTINTAMLVCGLLIAVAITAYASRLERRLRNQLSRNALHTQNLRRLSAELVHAQEEERRTISRELHDEIGQALTAIKLEIGMAQRKAEQTGHFSGLLDVAESTTDTAIETVRHLSQLLHPSMLDHLGLPAALEWYLQGFSKRTGIHAELTAAGVDGRFSSEAETCLFRIAQEALTNVARHAGATACRVRLERIAGGLQMIVWDNGRGFDLKRLQGQEHVGLGLLGIRERVTGFGGSLVLETAPGEGTSLIVELPNIECPRQANGREPREAAAQHGGAS